MNLDISIVKTNKSIVISLSENLDNDNPYHKNKFSKMWFHVHINQLLRFRSGKRNRIFL